MPAPASGHSSSNHPPGGASVRALSVGDIRRVAQLARLHLSEEQVAQYQTQLSAVLGYMDQLRAIGISGIEPMSHAGGGVNRLDDDFPRVPSDTLPVDALLRMAPATMDHFVLVPKVIGEGGGA